tara:strand:- start:168 stop:443 length:276 start_codon:yes stop_codon:yes gene_type:complete
MKNRIKLDDIAAQIERLNIELGRKAYDYSQFGQSYSLDSNGNASGRFESIALFSSKRALYDALTLSLAIIDRIQRKRDLQQFLSDPNDWSH